MADRPNVLVVCTDQQAADAMSCAGTDYVETPAMDRLAETGVRFTNAYCTYPLCTPSRSSFLAGQMPHEIGVLDNGSSIDESYRERRLSTLFASAGYDCAYAGKWHAPEGTLPDDGDHCFERLCPFNDDRVAEACGEFLREDREDPFLLFASFSNPHDICEWARDQHLPWGGVDDVPVEECPPLPANVEPPPFEPACIEEYKNGNPFTGGAMRNASDERWRQYRHAYFRLVERVDAHVGEILDSLEASGVAENTVVVFLSDHGDGNGSHRVNQKTLLYEECVRVPLIVSDLRQSATDEARDELVSIGLDLLPTLCDYAGIDVPAEAPGRSLRPVAEGRAGDWREFVVAQTAFDVPSGSGGYNVEGRMVRSERYKYVVYSRGSDREQLFDLEDDPGEMVDLSTSARHADVLDGHRERLLEWCLQHGDRFDSHWVRRDVPAIPGFEFADVYERLDADRSATDLDWDAGDYPAEDSDDGPRAG